MGDNLRLGRGTVGSHGGSGVEEERDQTQIHLRLQGRQGGPETKGREEEAISRGPFQQWVSWSSRKLS